MKNNVLIIVIDALSKWYIDQCKEKESFFSHIENKGYSAQNMYSTGPFTEAAVRGFWAADDPLLGKSYLSEADFRKDTLYGLFRKNGYYIYMGQLIPFFNKKIQADNYSVRENCELRGFDHVWRNRLNYYIGEYNKELFTEKDLWKLEYILDCYFDDFAGIDKVELEKEKYKDNKKEYIYDILKNAENSSFFQGHDKKLFYVCKYRNTTNFTNQKQHGATEAELRFLHLANNKNKEFLFKMNERFNCKDFIESELNGTSNRCLHSNDNLISHMRDENDALPKLKEELDDFLNWYDAEGSELDKPYFAYIHNYDFHFPENFMNNRYLENPSEYFNEVIEKTELLKSLQCKKMSVSKQLCVLNIEKCLEEFWEKIEQRGIFDNTYVILTADHGISNFMYPIDKRNERWNYTKFNFQIPFYMQGPEITEQKVEALRTSKLILPTVSNLCGLEQSDSFDLLKAGLDVSEEYISVCWVNGVPDLDRQKIKLGLRSANYSITYESYLTEFFSVENIKGIYDLLNDPDECYNLCYSDVKAEGFQQLLNRLPDLWYENIINIMHNDKNGYDYAKQYNFLIKREQSFKELNHRLKHLSKDNFCEVISNYEIILFGDNQGIRQFMNDYAAPYEIKELWKIDVENGWFMGHKVFKPNSAARNSRTKVIIVSRHEMELASHLLKMGLREFYIKQRLYDGSFV